MSDKLVFGDSERDERYDERDDREERNNRDRRDTRDDRDDRDDRYDDRESRGRREGRRDDRRNDAIDAFFSGANRTQFGGISNKTLNELVKVFESINSDYDDPSIDEELSRRRFQIHPIDGQATNPTLVIGLPIKLGNVDHVFYYSLVLEIPGVQMREVRRYRRDEPQQLPVFSEDRMDSRWREAVRAAVGRIGTGTPVEAGFQLIPYNLLQEEVSEGSAREDVLAIFTNAVDAICGFREMMAAQQGLNVPAVCLTPKFVGDDRRFEASFDFSRKPRLDTSKLPIRSDIALTIYHTETPRGYDNEHLVPTRRPIGTVSVAVDLIAVNDGEVSGWGRRRSRDEERPFWQAVLNITDIVGEVGIPWSIENSLLLMGSTTLLANNFRWVEGLRPRSGTEYKPLEELSALWLAHPDPKSRGVAQDITPNTEDGELSDFLDFTVNPEPYYGMVLSIGSEKGWANSIFERIALAEGEEADALIKTLYNACDKLTGNEFSNVLAERGYSRRKKPVETTDNRVFTGYFRDNEGNVRDIREWNVPAILTLVKDDPAAAYEIAMEYQDTLMTDSGTELASDLAERYRILKLVVGDNAFHLNGTAEMIQVMSWFQEVLAIAMVRSEMMPHINDGGGLRSRIHRSSSYSGDTMGSVDIGRRRNRDGDDFDRRRSYGAGYGRRRY